MVKIELTIEDGITPTLQMASKDLQAQLVQSLNQSVSKAGRRVQKRYLNENNQSWQPLSHKWLAYKENHGFDPAILHMTNWLNGVVTKVGFLGGQVFIDESGVAIDYSRILDQFIEDTPYVFYHEYRHGRNPKRAFIQPALKENDYEIGMAFNRALNRWMAKQQQGIKPIVSTPTKDGRMFVPTVSDTEKRFYIPFISWVLPPSSIYSYVGLIGDVTNAVRGSFFQAGAIEAYVQAYIRGQAHLSTGAARRGVRRGLYGNYKRR
jgi:hypothetical protein